MDFSIRKLEPSDYEEVLVGWWKDWGWQAPAQDFLPENGEGGLDERRQEAKDRRRQVRRKQKAKQSQEHWTQQWFERASIKKSAARQCPVCGSIKEKDKWARWCRQCGYYVSGEKCVRKLLGGEGCVGGRHRGHDH